MIERERRRKHSEAQKGGVSQYYGIEAVLAVGVIGGLGYYIYRTKRPSHGPSRPGVAQRPHTQSNNPPHRPPKKQLPLPQSNKFEMD